jgi:hypothetical protein
VTGLATSSAFTVDETYDRDYSSDGRSRFGAYLRERSHMFRDGDGLMTESGAFALSAWRIAQSPIMAPGYVRTHPRVLSTEAYRDDDHRVAITVQVAAPLPAALVRAIDGWRWRGWERVGFTETRWVEPYDNDRPAAFTTVALRVPLAAAALPAPRYRAGVPETATAKRAVRAICDLLNDHVRPVLAELDRNS